MMMDENMLPVGFLQQVLQNNEQKNRQYKMDIQRQQQQFQAALQQSAALGGFQDPTIPGQFLATTRTTPLDIFDRSPGSWWKHGTHSCELCDKEVHGLSKRLYPDDFVAMYMCTECTAACLWTPSLWERFIAFLKGWIGR